jgi:YYY domain-containing protein
MNDAIDAADRVEPTTPPEVNQIDRQRYSEFLLLIGILLIAAWLRFNGMEWGKNLYLHPDERFQTMVAMGIDWPNSVGEYFDSASSPLNPYNRDFGSYIYGTFPLFMSKLLGSVSGHDVYGNAHLPGRAFSATCDLVTVLLMYLVGRRLFDYRAGLLAAALGATTVLQIQSAHYFTTDSAVVVFCLAAFYFAIRASSDGRIWWHLTAGSMVALAVASKINALPIVLVLVMPVFDSWRESGIKSTWRRRPDSRISPVVSLCLAAITAIWIFRFAQPYAFAGPSPFSFRLDPRWVDDIRFWRSVQSGVGDSPPAMQWADRTPVLFSLKNLVLWGMGPLLGLTAILALLLASFKLLTSRRTPPGWQLVLIGWPAYHLLYYGSGFVQTMRYLLPAYPFLVLLAAAPLIRIADIGHARKWGNVRLGRRIALPRGSIPATIVLAGTLLYAVGFNGIYSRTTTREAATLWIYDNVPAGSVIASEHWDDGIPVSLPGFDAQQYSGFQLELFFPDDEAKLDTLVRQLGEADYLVLTSNRLYATIPRIPERYPMTSAYYELLFSNELGFDLVHTETSYPTYAGFELNDDGAEEAFTVYDHPKVFIFQKSSSFDAVLIEKRLASALGDGGYAIAPIYAGENLLMMDEQTRINQQASGTWRRMFNPDSIANRFPVLIWYLSMQIIALAAVPFCWRVFRSLPDCGYAVAKTLGLLGTSFSAWMIASLGVMPFGPDTVGLGIVLVCGASALIARNHVSDLIQDLRQRWRVVAFSEGLFLICFLGGVWLRMQNPDLWHRYRGGEKPMDFAYFNAILRSTSFPPFDPWFAGGYLHYYYFGFVQWASLTRLTGIVPEVAYNLALPAIFALLCLNVWSVALALITALRRTTNESPRWRTFALGLLAPIFVAVLGNLDLVQRIGRGEFGYPQRSPNGTWPHYGGIADISLGIWNAIVYHPPRPPDIYWSATRIIPGTINEFPAFSFLFADLHAHLMAMPLASAALLLACQIALGPGRASSLVDASPSPARNSADPGTSTDLFAYPRLSKPQTIGARARDLKSRWGWTVLEIVVAGFLTSALYATNTWDFPIYLVILLGASVIREGVSVGWRLTFPFLVRAGVWGAGVVAAGRILFWPFYASFVPQSGVVQQPERTPVSSFLTIHGLFLLALAGFVLVELFTATAGRTIRLPIPKLRGAQPAPGIAHDGGASWSDLFLDRLATQLFGILAVTPVLLMTIGLLADQLRLVLVGALVLVAVTAWQRRDDQARLALLFLAGIALGLGLIVEQIALKGDIGRMNTVFKLYLQAWILFGVVAAVGIVAVWTNKQAQRSAPVWTWSAALVVLIAGAAVYPALSVPARLGDRFASRPPTIDGMAYMNSAVYDDIPENRDPVSFPLGNDLAAINWLRLNVDGSPVILEATLPGYRWGSRVSVYTGLPTVLGWDWHETQQRPGFGMMIEERRNDVRRMLGETNSFGAIRPLLDKYHVGLIYIGDLERAYYDDAALAKFDAAVEQGELTIVYKRSGVTIYEYARSAGPRDG